MTLQKSAPSMEGALFALQGDPMTDSSDKPHHVIEFTPSPPDSSGRALPRIHRQRHVMEGGAIIAFQVNCPRDGDFFDLHRISELLKGLGLYKKMRSSKRVLRSPGVSGRTFERAIQQRDAVSREGILFCCETIVDALVDKTLHALGAHRDELIEGLMCHAEYRWVIHPKFGRDDGAPCDALALAIISFAKRKSLDNALSVALDKMVCTSELPDEWFCGQALAWLIRQCRHHHKLTQEELCRRMNYELGHVRHLRRWESGECLPEIEALDVMARAIHQDSSASRHQLLVWFKLARLVDWILREKLAHLDQPINGAPLLTPEWRRLWWEEGMAFKRRRLKGTLSALWMMTDQEFEQVRKDMKCGAEPIPAKILQVLKLRHSLCALDSPTPSSI